MSDDATWWRQADEVFDRLLDHPDEERDAELARLAVPAEVSRRVAVLLAADRREKGILEAPLLGTSLSDAMRGRRLGRWELEGEVGRGGMAVVYRARSVEEPIGLVAAVKILTLGALAARGGERIREEQKALARLRHPHIATLIDSGVSDDGTPWFAMALIEGERIDAWCQARNLGVRERLVLFLGVCNAVGYAHSNLVVHRDIKPSNVLVDHQGHVRLLDFGIARFLTADGAPQTLTQNRSLSPQYAAPEQFFGAPASTAMDVYGLGALLYRMLTGMPPRDLLSQPDAPVTLPSRAVLRRYGHRSEKGREESGRIQGDLDAVLVKALATDSDRRYPSVAALSADVTRWLEGRPIEARPWSIAYRLGKFLKRHRLGVVAAGLVLFAVTAGLIGTLWQANRAYAEARLADEEAELANAARSLLLELFEASDPTQTGGEEPDLSTILARGVERARQPASLPPRMRAELLSDLGRIYANLGRYAEGEGLLNEAIALWEEDDPGPSRFEARLSRARLWQEQGRARDAVHQAEQLVEEVRRDPGAERAALARALVLQSETRIAAEMLPATARSDALEAVELTQLEFRDAPLIRGRALHALAMTERKQGELTSAESAARGAIALYERSGKQGRAWLRAALTTLSAILSDQGRHVGTLELSRRALQLTREIYGHDSVLLARTLSNHGVVLIDHGRFEDAGNALEEAATMQQRAVGRTARLAPTLFNLGALREAQGRFAEASGYFREALDLRRDEHGESDAHVILINVRLAEASVAMGQIESAASLFDEVERSLSSSKEGVSSPILAEAATNLAKFRLTQGRSDSSLQWIRRAQGFYALHPAASTRMSIKAALVELASLQKLGLGTRAHAAWKRIYSVLQGIAEEERYFVYDRFLMAAQLALEVDDRDAAATLYAQSEAALAGYSPEPRLAAEREALAKRLASQASP